MFGYEVTVTTESTCEMNPLSILPTMFGYGVTVTTESTCEMNPLRKHRPIPDLSHGKSLKWCHWWPGSNFKWKIIAHWYVYL